MCFMIQIAGGKAPATTTAKATTAKATTAAPATTQKPKATTKKSQTSGNTIAIEINNDNWYNYRNNIRNCSYP